MQSTQNYWKSGRVDKPHTIVPLGKWNNNYWKLTEQCQVGNFGSSLQQDFNHTEYIASYRTRGVLGKICFNQMFAKS